MKPTVNEYSNLEYVKGLAAITAANLILVFVVFLLFGPTFELFNYWFTKTAEAKCPDLVLYLASALSLEVMLVGVYSAGFFSDKSDSGYSAKKNTRKSAPGLLTPNVAEYFKGMAWFSLACGLGGVLGFLYEVNKVPLGNAILYNWLTKTGEAKLPKEAFTYLYVFAFIWIFFWALTTYIYFLHKPQPPNPVSKAPASCLHAHRQNKLEPRMVFAFTGIGCFLVFSIALTQTFRAHTKLTELLGRHGFFLERSAVDMKTLMQAQSYGSDRMFWAFIAVVALAASLGCLFLKRKNSALR